VRCDELGLFGFALASGAVYGRKIGFALGLIGFVWLCFSGAESAVVFVSLCQIKVFDPLEADKIGFVLRESRGICRGFSTKVEVPYRHVTNRMLDS
jgi:hypothetical protein